MKNKGWNITDKSTHNSFSNLDCIVPKETLVYKNETRFLNSHQQYHHNTIDKTGYQLVWYKYEKKKGNHTQYDKTIKD